MIVLSKEEILARVDFDRAAEAIESAYRASSAGEIELPPVGHIVFPEYDADCHIKYGHRRGDEVFVIKVATGFPSNAAADGPVNNGLSLVLSATTGAVRAILHDEMLLTDIRTGIGGAIASRTLARADATRLLIVGTGIQADQQIRSHLALLGQPLDIEIWGRSTERAERLAASFDGVSACASIGVAESLDDACAAADIIVTTTAAKAALVGLEPIRPGTHITAVGADAPGKHELSPDLLAVADVLVADSREQCLDHGEFSVVAQDRTIIELGEVLAGTSTGRSNADQVTVADLTGIAAQDIAMASVVLDGA